MFPGSINKKNKYILESTFEKKDVYETDISDTDSEEGSVALEDYNNYINDDNNENNDVVEIREKICVYDLSNDLDYDLNNIVKTRYTNLSLCIYSIYHDSMIPFLQYYLEQNILFGHLDFPSIYLDFYSDIYEQVDLIVNSILIVKDKYTIKGFKNFKEINYIFIDIGNNEIKIDNSFSFLALMDEITNTKKIYDKNIDNKVTNLFIENPEFIFLKNKNNNKYEIPISVYQCVEEKRLSFTFMFGITKSDNSAIMGPYFYFSNYVNTIEKIKKKEGKYGIIRSGIFLGSMKVPMNFLEDEIDKSLLKKELVKQNNKEAILTWRISDHDGEWSNIYDSVYLGRTELDDGSLLKDTPIWVIKNHCQQYSLSYKIINKKIIIK
jgi:hypothetical protein